MTTYTIGQMAERMGVATSTLRYYDSEGLLPFLHRTAGGAREFRDEDMPAIAIIGCLKACGMPIRDIRRYIELCDEGDSTIAERLEMIRAQRERVRRKIRDLQLNLDALDYKVWYYSTAARLGSVDAVKTMDEEDVPPELREARSMLNGHLVDTLAARD